MIKLLNPEKLTEYSKSVSYYIYVLHFGHKLYIGRTNRIFIRIKAHLLNINKIISGKYNINNQSTYRLIIDHIKQFNIQEMSFSIYCKCNDAEICKNVERCIIRAFTILNISLNVNGQRILYILNNSNKEYTDLIKQLCADNIFSFIKYKDILLIDNFKDSLFLNEFDINV